VRCEVNVWRGCDVNVLGLWGTSGRRVNVRSGEAVEEGNCNLCYVVIILCCRSRVVSPNLCLLQMINH